MIEEGLTAALKSAWPSVGVFPSIVPEGQKPPFIAYREVDADDDDSVVFEIDACALGGLDVAGYRRSKELASAIYQALKDGFAYTGGCVLRANLTKRSDLVDQVEPMHWTRAQYSMKLDKNPY